MADDGKNEKLRFSRSGRILRKSLKMKEMEEIELEESRLVKKITHLPTPSSKLKTGLAVDSHGVSDSNSSGSSIGFETEDGDQETTSDSKSSTYHEMEDDNCLMDYSENWSSYSSTRESSDSTYEAHEFQKYRLEPIAGRGKCSKNFSSKSKIRKSSLSAARRSIGPNEGFSKLGQSRKIHITQRKAMKDRKGPNPEPRLLPKPVRSTRKSSDTFSETDIKNDQRATLQYSLDQSITGCSIVDDRSMQSVDSYTLEQEVEHPLGISPIDVAAHLKLLGDNLTEMATKYAHQDLVDEGVEYTLLASILSAVGPLLCLTREIRGLEGLDDGVFRRTLEHIVYIIPGMQE